MIYQWREGSRFKIKPNVFGRVVSDLAAANGGIVPPKAIVAVARPDDSPLHPAFEWRDGHAAELYREDQARHLIRSLVTFTPVGADPTPRQVIAYVHVKTGDASGYVSTVHAMGDPEFRDLALREALALLRGVLRRFEHLGELAELVPVLDRIAEGAGAIAAGGGGRH